MASRNPLTGQITEEPDGASRIRPMLGTGEYTHTRYAANVTGKVAFLLPTGVEFASLSFSISPNSTAAASVIALIGIDVEDDTAADALLGTSSVPASASADVLWFPGHVAAGGAQSAIEINGALQHGRIYIRSSDGATGLNIWMGAQEAAR